MLCTNSFQVGLIGRIGFAATRISDYLAVHDFSSLCLVRLRRLPVSLFMLCCLPFNKSNPCCASRATGLATHFSIRFLLFAFSVVVHTFSFPC